MSGAPSAVSSSTRIASSPAASKGSPLAAIHGASEARSAGAAHPRPPEQGRDERLAVLRVREGPAGGRLVEGDAEAPVARGGDRRGGANRIRDAPGELDPAPVPPEERHRERPVVGDGDDGRLRPLVREGGRHRPDQDPGRADADDGAPRLEELADVAGRVREPHVGVAGSPPEPVHLRVAEVVRNSAREPTALRGNRDHRDTLFQPHRTFGSWARTMEIRSGTELRQEWWAARERGLPAREESKAPSHRPRGQDVRAPGRWALSSTRTPGGGRGPSRSRGPRRRRAPRGAGDAPAPWWRARRSGRRRGARGSRVPRGPSGGSGRS